MNRFLRFLNSIHPRNIFFDFVRLTLGPALCLSFWPKYHYTEGAKKHRFIKGGALIACNHVSYMDGMMVCMAFLSRRPHLIVASEVFEMHPVMGLYLKAMRSIPVNREKVSLNVSRNVIKMLKRGEVVGIFPEGKIAWDGKMNEFKSGLSFYSFGTGATIVPMLICSPPKAHRRNHFVLGRRIYPSAYAGLPDGKADFERDILAEFAAMEEVKNKVYEKEALKKEKRAQRKAKRGD